MTKQAKMISTLVIAGFIAIVVVRVLQSKDTPRPAAPQPAMALPSAAEASETKTKNAQLATLPPKSAPVPAQNGALGSASGAINFASGTSGRAKSVSIRLQVRSAIGVWQPAKSRMRILLLEGEPASAEVEALLTALRAGGEPAITSARHAMIEMAFVPSAQAFDRNDLETATLIARDGALTSTANALNGLSWTGSLPSPQVTPPPGFDFPRIELTSDGNTEAIDGLEWHQAWHVSLSVPVVMRD